MSSHSHNKSQNNPDTHINIPSTSDPISRPDGNPPAYPGATPSPNINGSNFNNYGTGERMNRNEPLERDPLLGSGRRQGRQMPSSRNYTTTYRPDCFAGWFTSIKNVFARLIKKPLFVIGAIIAVVGLLIVFLVAICESCRSCSVPNDAATIIFDHSIDPSIYKDLTLRLEKGITGDVKVYTARDRNQSDIIIRTSMKASSPTMLQVMTPQLTVDPLRSKAESRIFLNLRSNKEIDQALKRNCTKVNVEIIFPKSVSKYDVFEVLSLYKGDVRIEYDREVISNQLFVEAENGHVKLRNVVVNDELNVEARGGSIDAKVAANSVVRLTSTSYLDLELASYSSNLDARATCRSGHADVVLTRPFFGHFLIQTISRPPELYAWPTYLVIKKSDNYTFDGYFTWNGYEPWYLPRIIIDGLSARLKVTG